MKPSKRNPRPPQEPPQHRPEKALIQRDFDQLMGMGAGMGSNAADGFIEPALLRAYRETLYAVHASPPFVLQVGQYSRSLADLCARQHVRCAAYITACNPWSQPLDEAANARRHAELTHVLTMLGQPFIPGIGRHPSGDWPGEPSCLVPGLSLDKALALGWHWQQIAILWSSSDYVPQIIPCAEPP